MMLRNECACLVVLLVAVSAARAKRECGVVVGMKPRVESTQELEAAFWEISTPGSARYLSHLSLEDAAEFVAASASDVAAVIDWLAGSGFENVRSSALGDSITASITCSDMDALSITSKACPVEVDFVLRKDYGTAPQQYAKTSLKAAAGLQGSYSIPNQKKAYGIPADLAAQDPRTLQFVWGPGTFGYSKSELENLKNTQVPLLNLDKVQFDTKNHGEQGGDNFGEGNLDTQMITSFGLNITTVVSNTNASMSTEEGQGFGLALLDFLTELASRKTVPHVLSLSLGSLSAFSCDLLCEKAQDMGHSKEDCNAYLQTQRQVCMFLSKKQTDRISTALKFSAPGASVFLDPAAMVGRIIRLSPFQGGEGTLSDDLNAISCNYTLPVFPTTSPYIISVGGTEWKGAFFLIQRSQSRGRKRAAASRGSSTHPHTRRSS